MQNFLKFTIWAAAAICCETSSALHERKHFFMCNVQIIQFTYNRISAWQRKTNGRTSFLKYCCNALSLIEMMQWTWTWTCTLYNVHMHKDKWNSERWQYSHEEYIVGISEYWMVNMQAYTASFLCEWNGTKLMKLSRFTLSTIGMHYCVPYFSLFTELYVLFISLAHFAFLCFFLFICHLFARSQLFHRFFFVVVIHIDFINAIVTVCWAQFPFLRTMQHKEYGICFLISILSFSYTHSSSVFLLTHTKTWWNACFFVYAGTRLLFSSLFNRNALTMWVRKMLLNES